MGDYTKLIINCDFKAEDREKVEQALDKLPRSSSTYHCGGELCQFDTTWVSRGIGDTISLSLITQTKYGQGIEEFLDAICPLVVSGFGLEDVIGLRCNEYEDGLYILYKDNR